MNWKEMRGAMSSFAFMYSPVAKAERALPGSPNTSETIQ
jgi:hypothetical protein